MRAAPTTRLATVAGFAIALAGAAWWLAATRLALERGGDPAAVAGHVLVALALTRALAVAATAVEAGTREPWRVASGRSLSLVAPAWPLVAVAAQASTRPLAAVVAAEALVALAAVLLPALGLGLRRLWPVEARASLAATFAGVVVAAVAWATRQAWTGA